MSGSLQRLSPFISASISRRGGRPYNEDCHSFISTGETACWVVADGLGGHQGGKAASSIAVETILGSFRRRQDLSPKSLALHFDAAQNELLRWQKTDHAFANMQTTAVVLTADRQSALWGHIGDSRLYYFEGGRIVCQTRDHSVVEVMVQAGDLSFSQIRRHQDRNRLLRALGSAAGEIRPEISARKRVLCDSSVFLLCTDGFWEHVTESEMEIDLAKSAAPNEWLARMETRLLVRAAEENDNYTALVVFVCPGTRLGV